MAAQRNLHPPIAPDAIRQALAGELPPIGHALSLADLGRRLAFHRPGVYAGEPFRKQTISDYLKNPEKQGPDFIHAFHSWTLAETRRQEDLTLVVDGMTVDELLLESGGRAVQLGDTPAQTVIVVGLLPAGALIDPDGITSRTILNRAPIRQCVCGAWFIARSWNHRRCGPDCPGEKR